MGPPVGQGSPVLQALREIEVQLGLWVLQERLEAREITVMPDQQD